MIKKGEILELEIESLAYGGKGVAKVNDFVVFVKNAIPGQKVNALVFKKRSGYAEARPVEVLVESQDHRENNPDTYLNRNANILIFAAVVLSNNWNTIGNWNKKFNKYVMPIKDWPELTKHRSMK